MDIMGLGKHGCNGTQTGTTTALCTMQAIHAAVAANLPVFVLHPAER